MELRSRSRSKTPLIRTSIEKEIFEEGSQVETIIRTTRSTTTKSTESSRSKSANVSMKSVKEKPVRKKYITSDYSSEEGESEYGSPQNISQNTRNQIIEEARKTINGNAKISALKIYKDAGEYWNKFPKTDYTYSRHSRDRVELAPGVVAMPNMSRRSLHNYETNEYQTLNKHTNTDYYEDVTDHRNTAKKSKVRRVLYSNNNYDSAVEETSSSSLTIRITSFFQTIVRMFTGVFGTIFHQFNYYSKQSSWFMWIAKRFYMIVCAIMLWDSWLLRRVQHNKRLSSLLLLCLLPLLFFGGWWLLSGLSHTVYGTIFNSTRFELFNQETQNVPVETIYNVKETTQDNHLNYKGTNLDADYIIEKILESPKIKNIINNNHNNINTLLENRDRRETDSNVNEERQQAVIDNLKEEINKIRLDLSGLEKARSNDITNIVARVRHENIQNNARMTMQLNKCCRRSFIQIEGYLLKLLKDLFAIPNHITTQNDISLWLQSLFVAKSDLETRLSNLTRNLRSDFDELVQNNGKRIMDDVATKISKELNVRVEKSGKLQTGVSISETEIRRIVLDSLAIYDADKTGLVDYALEPSGGQILSTRCTETYQAKTAVVSILGIPLWYPSNTPRTVITPGVSPGECWAFQNFPGFLIIKLTGPIRIEMFSYEHINKMLVPNGRIDSAPKDFSVFGLKDENDKDPVEIGRYSYSYEGEPLQYFPANSSLIFNIVELRIYSNHGNPNYTCLYRFRVHGSLNSELT